MQLASWFDSKGANEAVSPGVIAQIYFRTNEVKLDAADRRALESLVAYVRYRLAREERVELAIVGHADHRGGATYNQKLGLERAKAVARELNTELHYDRLQYHRFFSGFTGVSSGETYAVQRSREAVTLAADRRVDVWLTNPFYRLRELPPLDNTLTYQRLVHSEYAQVNAKQYSKDSTGQIEDFTGEALKSLTLAAIDKLLGTHVPGVEGVKYRRYAPKNTGYRVNVVNITTYYRFETVSGGEVESWLTDVDYTWGSPLPVLLVSHVTVSNVQGMPEKKSIATKTILRGEADQKSFFFPPPLESGIREHGTE